MPSFMPKVCLAQDWSHILGSSHVAGKYYFTSRDFLNEGAIAVSHAGMRIIKVWLNYPQVNYPWNSQWPDGLARLLDIARHPHFQELFNRPFDVYVLTTFKKHDYLEGLTDWQVRDVEQEYYLLARHLLQTYRSTGKRFIISHHEGDWHLRGTTDRSRKSDPGPTAIQGMIQWYNARQAGVDRARNEVGEDGVKVKHAAEVNLVVFAMEGRPTVTRDVLPHVKCDMVAYSAYDTTHPIRKAENEARYRKMIRDALDYIESKLIYKPADGSKNVFISEFGAPEMAWGKDDAGRADLMRICRATVEEAHAWGCPYLIFWQVYCNERLKKRNILNLISKGVRDQSVSRNEQCRGFWLIRADSSYSDNWYYFTNLIGPYLVPADDFTASVPEESKCIRLSWTRSQNNVSFCLERSVNHNPFQAIDLPNPKAVFYEDKNIKKGDLYQYRLRSEKPGFSPTSWFYTGCIQYDV